MRNVVRRVRGSVGAILMVGVGCALANGADCVQDQVNSSTCVVNITNAGDVSTNFAVLSGGSGIQWKVTPPSTFHVHFDTGHCFSVKDYYDPATSPMHDTASPAIAKTKPQICKYTLYFNDGQGHTQTIDPHVIVVGSGVFLNEKAHKKSDKH